jgi:redox-sensitive bicupin YhaK (pirin superfamily)
MIDHRPYSRLASANLGWLNARHHFPVHGLVSPAHKPIGPLYVWNDDEFAPRSGFPLHYHQDVEIITYVRRGAVTHQDTLGNTYELSAGDIQVMSAGSGLRHSEVNRGDSPLKLFQIWIAPNQVAVEPTYAIRRFPGQERANRLAVLASGAKEDIASGAVPLNADARLLAGRLDEGSSVTYECAAGHSIYLVPASGQVRVNDVTVNEGDGVAITKESRLELTALQASEVVVVELART